MMSAQGYSLEVGKVSTEPEYELSGGHVHGTSSKFYQQNPAYNVVTPEAACVGAKRPPVYQEIQVTALPADGSNPVQKVMSTPNVVRKVLTHCCDCLDLNCSLLQSFSIKFKV